MDLMTLSCIAAFAPLVGSIVAGLLGWKLGRAFSHWATILSVAISFAASAAAFAGAGLVPGATPQAANNAGRKKYALKKSINQWAFPYPDRMNLEECLKLAKDAGFDGIELNYDLDNDLSPKSGTREYEKIRALADRIGFHYKWDDASHQWAHATGIMVATPEGKLSQYFYGLEYSGRDLRLSLVEASHGKIGNVVDRVLLYCYHYDAATGKYGIVVMRTIRIFGTATALLLFAFMFAMFRREAREGRL